MVIHRVQIEAYGGHVNGLYIGFRWRCERRDKSGGCI